MDLKRAFDDIVQLSAGSEDQVRASLRIGAQLACEAIVDATSNYDRPELRALTDRVLASLDSASEPKPLLDLMTQETAPQTAEV